MLSAQLCTTFCRSHCEYLLYSEYRLKLSSIHGLLLDKEAFSFAHTAFVSCKAKTETQCWSDWRHPAGEYNYPAPHSIKEQSLFTVLGFITKSNLLLETLLKACGVFWVFFVFSRYVPEKIALFHRRLCLYPWWIRHGPSWTQKKKTKVSFPGRPFPLL